MPSGQCHPRAMATQEPQTDVEQEITDTFGMVPAPLSDIPADDMGAEWPTFRKYVVGESEIPAKYRELLGLAVAANIKCPYCQEFHKGAAKMHGATEEELREVAFLASFTARYSALIHGLNYDVDTFREEFARIAEHMQQHMGAAADD